MNKGTNFLRHLAGFGGWGLPLPRRGYHVYDPLKDVDIEAEYKLIQEKKSKLSASQRRMVVIKYENKE